MFNASKLAGALGLSGQTVSHYLDGMVVLLLVRRLSPWAVEIKRGLAPRLTRGFRYALADLKPAASWLVYPGEKRYPFGAGTGAIPVRN